MSRGSGGPDECSRMTMCNTHIWAYGPCDIPIYGHMTHIIQVSALSKCRGVAVREAAVALCNVAYDHVLYPYMVI